MNTLEEAQLLKQNREEVVAALNEAGFSNVDSSTPLSEVAGLMQWAGGLLDLRMLTINKTTNEYKSYTQDEWASLSASNKAAVAKLGLHVRAEGKEFIISRSDSSRSNGAASMPWAPNGTTNVSGLTDYGTGSTGMYFDFDDKGNTDKILAYGESYGITFEAATQARAYKASTTADGNYADPTEWSLPAFGTLSMMYRHRKKINEALTYFFDSSAIILADVYWSSTEHSASYAWSVHMNNGSVYYFSKSNTLRVRPVAAVPASVASPAI